MPSTRIDDVPWARSLSLSVWDVTTGTDTEYPFQAQRLHGTLDLTDEPTATECINRHDLEPNSQQCKINGIWNGCTLRKGCEVVMVRMDIDNPSMSQSLPLDWALEGPSGERLVTFSSHLEEHGGEDFPMEIPASASQYGNYQWIFFVAEHSDEIWRSGDYTMRVKIRNPDGSIATGEASFSVKTTHGTQTEDPDKTQGEQQKQSALEDHPDDQQQATTSSSTQEDRHASPQAETTLGLPQDTMHTALTIVLASLVVAIIQERT